MVSSYSISQAITVAVSSIFNIFVRYGGKITQTLIVYNSAGKIVVAVSGEESYEGTAMTVADVSAGYYVKSINPETGEPVLAEIPKTEEQQRLDELEAKQAEDDERYIDQEYRMTLIELGLTE